MSEESPDTIEFDRGVAKFVAVVLGLGGILVGAVALIAEGSLFDSLVAQIGLGVGLIGWLAFVLLDPGGIRTFFTGRQARYASNSLLMSLAFTAIVVLAFIVLLDLESNIEFLTLDLTEDQQFTMSQQTIDLLENLDEPLHITGFYTNRQSASQQDAETWLVQYEQKSNGMLTYEFIDPELRPGEAAQYDISRAGVLLFTQATRTAEASLADERNLTGALIRVQSGEPKRLYAIIGHGERSTDQFDDFSLQRATDVLTRENFEVETLNLFENAAVPDDADVVLVAGPTTQYRPEEVEAISAYLDGGGTLMMMVEPNAATGLRTSGVQGVAFSPDGSLMATASADDTAKLWNVGRSIPSLTLSGHLGDVQSVAFSPDSELIATASGDQTVRLWNTDGELLDSLEGHNASVWKVAFSPDGSKLASAGLDQAVLTWNVASGEIDQIFATQARALDVAYSPDGDLIAAAFEDGSVRMWDANSGEELASQRPHTGATFAVAFSPDGSTVLSGAEDGSVGVLDVESAIASTQQLYPGVPIADIIYADDDSVLLSLFDATVRGWDADLESEQFTLQTEHSDVIWQLALAPDGDTLATASGDGAVELWSLAEQERSATLRGHTGGDPLLTYLTEEWGITANDDLIVDPDSLFDEFTPVSSAYGASPITDPLLNANLPTFFTAARSFSVPLEPSPEVIVTQLVLGGSRGWGETNIALGIPQFDQDDIPGPLTVAVSGEDSSSGARLVVFGDVDFATNAALQQESFGNLDLFVNSLNWLVEEEELINIQPRSNTFRSFTPLSGPLTILVSFTTLCFIPAIVLAVGFSVFIRRRRRH